MVRAWVAGSGETELGASLSFGGEEQTGSQRPWEQSNAEEKRAKCRMMAAGMGAEEDILFLLGKRRKAAGIIFCFVSLSP